MVGVYQSKRLKKYCKHYQSKNMNNNIFKSIGAVVAGFVTIVILSVATDFLFEKLGVFPHQQLFAAWMLGIALAYRSVFTVVGGYVTASLAPKNSMRQVYVLMMLVFVGSVVGVIAGWGLGNQWYPISLAITGPLFVWVGGRLYKPRASNPLEK